MRTYSAKPKEIERQWIVIDAAGQPLGRLAVEIAKILRGKHKPIFTPNQDTGDFVIVVNAARAVLTGNKEQEPIRHHTGWPGGLKSVSRGEELARRPEEAVRRVVRGMLPHNRLGDAMIRKLKIYRGAEHPHTAQKPVLFQQS
ncbi:MAG: 50S ribosomal protein L13 [Armatimonadetes bacterium]|nr:50S ribosomal protein L13 [Armatimonadota bacterium]